MRALRLLRTAILPFALSSYGAAQTPAGRGGGGGRGGVDTAAVAHIRSQYQKTEVRVTMRDGTQLFTAIYAPRDTTRRYPFLMTRTPYGVAPYGPAEYPGRLGPTPRFSDDGFIFVYQDTRGRFMSDGYFQYMTPHLEKKNGPKDVDESTDTYDTIDWLVKHVAHNNGRVGTWGVSAPGFFTAAGMIDAHPAHRAASPQAPLIDWYFGDDRHHNGTLTLAQSFNFLMGFARARPQPNVTTYGPPMTMNRDNADGYRFFMEMGANKNADEKYFGDKLAFWDSMMAHPNYDAFWQKRSLAPHLKNISPAVLFVGGWFDAEDPYGPLRASKAMDTLSPKTNKTLIVGPWAHGAWGNGDLSSFGFIPFGQSTGPFFRDSVEFPFFVCALEDRCDQKLARAIMYETGENKWRTFDQWPPKGVTPRSLYLHASGGLSFNAPTEPKAIDSYVSDPSKPVPYTQAMSFGYFRGYPAEDQRFASARPDVLVYETPPLESDLTLAGQIGVSLKVASSGTDADFIVKVVDMYPNDAPVNPEVPAAVATLTGERLAGYEQLVKGDVFRARWRDSYSAPKPLVPGQPTSINYQLQDVFHTFKKGHRLMVQVQSTWFPLIDRNPQTYVPNINTAKASDFKPATMQVYRSRDLATHLTLPILPPSAIVP
jgi:putative CocE/NonD family hydrolase